MPNRPTLDLPESEQIALFRTMLLIRRSEERLARDFKAGLLPGPVHLYIGQEAVAVGVCAHLGDADWITSTHRGHGHFLSKGGDLSAMLDEIHGRATGICGGFGGSMHVADVSRGILGANGIVGGGIAIATGAALAQKMDGRAGVSVAFFGDGATTEGVLAEALNIAALWKLPQVFVCENNFYSEFSPTENVVAGAIADRGRPFGIPCEVVDGDDLAATWLAAGRAIARARAGEGPTFLEMRTYRFHGHVEGESAFLKKTYRDEGEVEDRRAADSVEAFRRYLIGDVGVDQEALAGLDGEVTGLVAEAADRASEAPWPVADRFGEFVMA